MDEKDNLAALLAQIATVTTGTASAQGPLVWWNPRTAQAAVRVRDGEPPVVGRLVRRDRE